MTLKEQLDAKVKKDCIKWLKKEIYELFLNTSSEDLKEGMTINIFYQNEKEIFYKIVGKKGENPSFKQRYHAEILKGVISLLREEELEVDDKKPNDVYVTYRPF